MFSIRVIAPMLAAMHRMLVGWTIATRPDFVRAAYLDVRIFSESAVILPRTAELRA
jgi:hypothetical protein